MLTRTFIALLILLLCGVAGTAAAADYSLRDLDGRLHRVSDYRGKWLVINFWATWCPPCVAEMPELERFYRENRARAVVWGVTFEATEISKIREFVARVGVSYPILGHGQDPLTGYGTVRGLPTTFVIDPQGKFVRRFEGPVNARDLIEVIEP